MLHIVPLGVLAASSCSVVDLTLMIVLSFSFCVTNALDLEFDCI